MKKIMVFVLFSTIHIGSSAENLGAVTYHMACSHCHASNVAKSIGAPAAFDKKAWKARFKQAKWEAKKNPQHYPAPMDYLLNSVNKGKNLMQHGGLCSESNVPKKNCSKEAFTQAILYMSGK